jgi:hypothetical protein
MTSPNNSQPGHFHQEFNNSNVSGINNFAGSIGTINIHQPTPESAAPLPNPGEGTVFLSYSHSDSDTARQVELGLQGRGITIWVDQSRLVGGGNWQAEIDGVLAGCRAVIVLLSQQALARQWSEHQAEIIKAGTERQRRDLVVVPARVDDCQIPPIPIGTGGERLDHLHAVDLFPDLYAGLDELAQAVQA